MDLVQIFLLIGGGLLGVVGTVVLLSYAFAWYEAANADISLVEQRFSARGLLLTMRLVAQETLLLMVTIALHPLGWIPGRERPLAPASETPVILLHGLFHNRACWAWIKFCLRRRGFQAIYTLNLPPWKDVEVLTERVAMLVDELRAKKRVGKVQLVGHSMGGIIARNYLQIRGGAQKVERCVLLGTPNSGSRLAPFALAPLGKLLLPGSEFLRRLAAAPLPAGIEITSIFSRHDNLVLPVSQCRLQGASHIELAGMGHAALLYHPRAIRAIIDCLKEPPQ